MDYFVGIISRAVGQRKRAERLHRMLSFYCGFNIVMAGHSNGCDIICEMLRDFPTCPRISRLHLVCAATDSDFNINGLNRMLSSGKVGAVTVYCAGRDRALRAADSFIGGWLGYGHLGLDGPKNVLISNLVKVATVRSAPWDGYGHSDCWSDANFERTMASIIG